MAKIKTTLVPSLAGTEAEYHTTPNIESLRMRLNEDDGKYVRIHIRKDILRDRPQYVALDVPQADLKAVFQKLFPVKAAKKKA